MDDINDQGGVGGPGPKGEAMRGTLEMMEYLESNTAIQRIGFKLQAPDGVGGGPLRFHLPQHLVVGEREVLREGFRLHRFHVMSWLMQCGVKIPMELLSDEMHPVPGRQVPDRNGYGEFADGATGIATTEHGPTRGEVERAEAEREGEVAGVIPEPPEVPGHPDWDHCKWDRVMPGWVVKEGDWKGSLLDDDFVRVQGGSIYDWSEVTEIHMVAARDLPIRAPVDVRGEPTKIIYRRLRKEQP